MESSLKSLKQIYVILLLAVKLAPPEDDPLSSLMFDEPILLLHSTDPYLSELYYGHPSNNVPLSQAVVETLLKLDDQQPISTLLLHPDELQGLTEKIANKIRRTQRKPFKPKVLSRLNFHKQHQKEDGGIEHAYHFKPRNWAVRRGHL